MLQEGQAAPRGIRSRGLRPVAHGSRRRAHLLSPSVDLDVHIDDVVRLLHYWDLREAIVVGHSYGGMVITGVGDPDDQRWMDERLTAHPWRSTLPTRDPALMEAARAAGRLWHIDTGHDLMIAEPGFVTDALARIAAA